MSSRLRVLAYLGPMSSGGSKPQLVLGSDGNKYVAKFIGSVHGTRLLANEYVAGCLARILDVPSPPVEILDADDSIVSAVNEKVQYSFMPGPAFASLYVGGENVQIVPTNSENMRAVSNADKWPNAIVFDVLTQNVDLAPWHLLITNDITSGKSRFWHIDHGHCLGWSNGWNTLKVEGLFIRNRLYPDLVSGSNPFEQAFEKLKDATTGRIKEILRDIPLQDWEIPSSDPATLAHYLEQAVISTPAAIVGAKKRYPKWV